MTSVPLSCATCNKAMQKTRTSAPQGKAVCASCRRSGAALKHGTPYAYRRGCRCAECKAAQAKSLREYAAKVRERDGVSPTARLKRAKKNLGPALDCFLCGKRLTNSREVSARYPLHKKCRESAPAWIRQGRDNPRRDRFQAMIDKAAEGTSGGGRVWTSGACEWCGDMFVGIGWTCSDKCRESRSYKRYRDTRGSAAFRISPVNRLAIYERDNWTCQICDLPVNRNAHFLDDDSATLDHIEPQSAALIPDHTPENLRTCHRLCNSYRSDGAWMTDEQVREIVTARFVLTA